MKAIETSYKGYRFRSRQEARWAVFFDSVGVPWEYEKEGYALSAGYYLPDFWLPTLDCFFEVKGASPTELEIAKSVELSESSRKLVALANGQTVTEPRRVFSAQKEWPVKAFNIQIFAGKACSIWPCISHAFGMWNWWLDTDLPPFIEEKFPDISLPLHDLEQRRNALIECDKTYYKEKYGKEHPRYIYGRHESRVCFASDPITKLRFNLEPDYEPSDISNAYAIARSARFEFGQSGA